jgi:hypothetical protein
MITRKHQIAINTLKHQNIEDAANKCLQSISVVLDFDTNLCDGSRDRLNEAFKHAVKAKTKNRVIWEHSLGKKKEAT